MTAITQTPHISSNDRFGFTLTMAILFHVVVILGISFTSPILEKKSSPPQLDITLVHSKSFQQPDDADFLAQASQDGGGNTSEKVRPTSPLTSPNRQPAENIAPQQQNRQQSPPQQKQQQKIVTSKSPRVVKQELKKTEITPKDPSAEELFSRSMELAAITAEIDQNWQAYAQMPKKKFISARTREYKFAAYMQAWVAKVERIGNLNYPDEARRKNLTGNLRLDVTINPDGQIKDIVLEKSSGHRLLDDAAIRIVQLSAPFAAFPESFRDEVDELHVIRTWVFSTENQLSSKH